MIKKCQPSTLVLRVGEDLFELSLSVAVCECSALFRERRREAVRAAEPSTSQLSLRRPAENVFRKFGEGFGVDQVVDVLWGLARLLVLINLQR